MLQTLFVIPAQIGGYPVFGFGLLLAAWAMIGICLLAWLAWRQGFNADTWGYVPILLLLGAIIAWLLPAICEKTAEGVPLGLPIRGYGVMILLAVVAGTALAAWRAHRLGLDPEMVLSLVFWILVPGILGARLFYVIQFWQSEYYGPAYAAPGGSLLKLIGEIVNVTKGGLVVYGSFLGGMVGLIAFVRKYRLKLLAVCDLMAPSMMLGLAIGRIGCLLNGCCFGAVCDHAWAITFPAHSIPYQAQVQRGQMYGMRLSTESSAEPRVLAVTPGSPAAIAGLKAGDRLESINGQKTATTMVAYWALERAFDSQQPLQLKLAENRAATVNAVAPPSHSLPVYPAQICSAVDAALLCVALLFYAPFRRRDGEVFALMLSIHPVIRFLIENVRSDEAPVFGTGLTISQNVSILLLLCAAALWWYILRQPRGVAWGSSRSSGD